MSQLSTTERTLHKRVVQFFHSYNLSPQEGILVAFSGGADSLTLLYVLASVYGTSALSALYVNHHLRRADELKLEIDANARRCDELGVPFHYRELGRGQVVKVSEERDTGIEEAARHLRYGVLRTVREELGYRFIATAHTRTDVLETHLMRLFQGSRLHFGSAVSPVTGDKIIRPLLSVDRELIDTYLSEKDLSGVHDSSNDDTNYLRNSIRHLLVPSLSQVFPGWESAVERVADEVNQVNRTVQARAEVLAGTVIRVNGEGSRVTLTVTEEIRRELSLLRRLLFLAFSALSFDAPRRLSDGQVNEVLSMVTRGGHSRVVTPDSYVSYQDGVLLWKKGIPALSSGYASLVYSQKTYVCGGFVLCAEKRRVDPNADRDSVWMPSSVPVGPLVVRSPRPGDFLESAGMKRGVLDVLAGWKIPKEKRWEIPVLCDDIGVLAVFGAAWGGRDRVAERVRATPLAPDETTLYSVRKDKGHDCG